MLPAALLLGAWQSALGPPAIQEAFDRLAPAELSAELSREKLTDRAQACPALVNAYRLSGEAKYLEAARRTADFIVAHPAKGEPAGWGPKLDKGYGFCPDRDDYTGKDLWDTTRALDCLLAYAAAAKDRPGYVALTRKVVDGWPSGERQGMRFFSKNAEPCARRYVKNTNIAMGEVLFRLARSTGEPRYQKWAEQTLAAERWEILTRGNFGYHGAMIYEAPDDPQNKLALSEERPKVETDASGHRVCRSARPDPSCWNHLGFEAYALRQVQQASGVDQSQPIAQIMATYRTSPLGDAQRFDWGSDASPTHVTAYNCYLRDSADPRYRKECLRALAHRPASAMIFYSLIPDWLVPP
jgi:hypothetical protein